jgi:formylglycine-generating enzyme required for sulfatase activity
MLLALKLKLAIAATALAAPIAAATAIPSPVMPASELAEIAKATFSYRLPGDFWQDGRQIPGPLQTTRLNKPLAIMKQQVTVREYGACMNDGACPKLPVPDDRDDVPMVGVNWHDATAYADWMTKKTGRTHRLPTDKEWTFAAAEKSSDESFAPVDPADRAQAWIARYEAEANRGKPDAPGVRPTGTFGQNSNGLLDLAGNVWEWTETCFVRATIDTEQVRVTNTNCGVRVVAGAHRSYMTDFIRDPRNGGCAAGVPPANLGFRLVAEPRPSVMAAAVRALRGFRENLRA